MWTKPLQARNRLQRNEALVLSTITLIGTTSRQWGGVAVGVELLFFGGSYLHIISMLIICFTGIRNDYSVMTGANWIVASLSSRWDFIAPFLVKDVFRE